jgi:hypothetical protein
MNSEMQVVNRAYALRNWRLAINCVVAMHRLKTPQRRSKRAHTNWKKALNVVNASQVSWSVG